MYTEKDIEKLFGTEVLNYLKHKNAGGINSSKGNQYEDIFAVYQLGLLSRCAIECNKEIYFLSQCFAFVDDLIIDEKTDNVLRHFQLKNSLSVSWGEGNKSICDDFQKQYTLNKSFSRQSEINLVVSSEKVRDKLAQNMPDIIITYSQVVYFSFEENLVKLINKDKNFRQAIEYLCAVDEPELDKLECVATVLLGAWITSNKSRTSVMDVIKKAQQSTPSYIRSFQKQLQLDPEVENIFNKIEGFTYKLTRGFLNWKFEDGLFEGTLPYSLEKDDFKRFQQLIKKHKPTSFEELEVFLI
ncbi:hypothetical protein [Brasilonema sp. UFV-L1]|uniref:hypothetical protein n=1 Tax=Brasilonema sp. UFV-L1 TaxID=2234130 RepID=UPI00145F5892|nr:hypothetical protein [Brasilonema sp. UFV-L1]NMG10701.1 hypothetical protein [Brasilonema sp. UFV-L1]